MRTPKKELPLRAVLTSGTYNITSWKRDGVYIGSKWVPLEHIMNIKRHDMSFNHAFHRKPLDYLRYVCKTTVAEMAKLVKTGAWINRIRNKIRLEPNLLPPATSQKNNKNQYINFVRSAGSQNKSRIYSLAQALFAKIFQNTRKYMEKFVEALLRFMSPEDIKDIKLPDIYEDALTMPLEMPEELKKPELVDQEPTMDQLKKLAEHNGISVHAASKMTNVDFKALDIPEFAPNYDVWTTREYQRQAKTSDQDQKRYDMIDAVDQKRHARKIELIQEKTASISLIDTTRQESMRENNELKIRVAMLQKEIETEKTERKRTYTPPDRLY
jgi:hypothetical protein